MFEEGFDMRKFYVIGLSVCLAIFFSTTSSVALAAAKKKHKKPPIEQVSQQESIAQTANVEDPVITSNPLDLSLPFKADHGSNIELDTQMRNEAKDSLLFSSGNKAKKRNVQLGGRVLMSQEQEAEKLKTVDGAGIVINVQR